jgi:hypothetical protein
VRHTRASSKTATWKSIQLELKPDPAIGHLKKT